MNPKKREKFTKYLDQRISEVNSHILQLTEDNRKDEADFEKIRSNIFQVLKTIFLASARISQQETEQMKYLERNLTGMTETWQKALDNAQQHNDEKRVLQEQTKLEVMNEVRNALEQLMEEGI